MTQYTQLTFGFGKAGRRDVVGRFDGGFVSSFGGVGLMMLVEQITGICGQAARCFTDHRDPELVEHSVEEMLKQRLFAMMLGYEDLNDHDQLRLDPLLAAAVGRADPTGANRRRPADRQAPLAGKSTLNRMELTPIGARSSARYKKIVADRHKFARLLVDLFLQAHPTPPAEIILDFDATDVTLHGDQPGKHYHGYYDDYCYLPLYVYCGDFVLAAKLRPSSIDAYKGSLEEAKRLVAHLREKWPDTRIILRADSGFCREDLMAWCESEPKVDYLFGLAQNVRLKRAIGRQLFEASQQYCDTGEPARRYVDLNYKPKTKSWSRHRRVVAKAECLKGDKPNPRFVVTSLSAEDVRAQALYEDHYCPRGEAENRIKETQLDLFGRRLSTTAFRANQLRLWLSAIAYTFMKMFVRLALDGSAWACMQTCTLRERLLRIGAQVRVTARKVWVHLSSGYPDQAMFAQIYDRLQRWVT